MLDIKAISNFMEHNYSAMSYVFNVLIMISFT